MLSRLVSRLKALTGKGNADSEAVYSFMSANPDVVIATPGRFLRTPS